MKKMKKIAIVSMILLIGAVLTGAVSASFDWGVGIVVEMPDDCIVEPGVLPNIKLVFNPPITGDVSLSTDKGRYVIGEPVEITIENKGDKPADFYGPSYYWIIEQHKD